MTPIMDNGNVDREEILRRFETLLDTALAGETAPAGIDAEILESVLNDSDSTPPGTDAYALWSAMTALTQEIKLQGRAFQELNRTLVTQTEKTAEELRAVYTERERTVRRDAERRSRRELLGALIDLRDRLARGRESAGAKEREMAAAKSAGWFARTFFGKGSGNGSGKRVGADAEALEALIRGYELGIERLDQTLEECQAKEIRCAGEAFDPRRMNAIDSEESAAVAPDTVLEVYRSGYEWEGEVFRPAQVKVARPPKVSRPPKNE
jgi:molecular chaperone GrpE